VWHLTLSSDLPLSKIDKFILLKRRDILGQLTSLMIATKTNCWRDKKSTHQIELNIAQLEWFIDREKKAHAAFESSGVEYKTVFYEDLCENFDETVKSIQDYLDLDYIRLEPAPLIKQETRPIQEIISNYEDVKWTLRDMNLHLDCDYPHWLTDIRHIEVIYEFLMANDFTRVAEVGSYSGFLPQLL
jgi:hypothetical protein